MLDQLTFTSDLQKRKMPTALSWFDSPSGPKHEVKWTSTCKGMGTAYDGPYKLPLTLYPNSWGCWNGHGVRIDQESRKNCRS